MAGKFSRVMLLVGFHRLIHKRKVCSVHIASPKSFLFLMFKINMSVGQLECMALVFHTLKLVFNKQISPC